MEKRRSILLSFDVEEFDIPTEYGQNISEQEQFAVSHEGLCKILEMIDTLSISCTFFITASFAIRFPDLIREMAQKHEIASHGYAHKKIHKSDIPTSKKVIEEIIGRPVKGFRSPRLQKFPSHIFSSCGYVYDSSENPIYLPGRYNNFFTKRTLYKKDGIWNLPASATPVIRLPLFWLSFKNFPFVYTKYISRWTLLHDTYLNIYFHPWEFCDLSLYNLPGIVKKIDGNTLLERLKNYILFLSQDAKFIPIINFINQKEQ